nr:RNA-directed DNA polymerase, eukaryota, reverse transcriptase zinc-binding domain protein [Tanacetum cinerariifolium]
MREAHYDYGPVLFNFFHYWFELDGFDKLVEQTWLEVNVNDQNSYSKFMNKLKYLKEKIRIWARLHKESVNSRKSILNAELADLDRVIDKGEGSDVDGHWRREVVRLIQEVEKVDAMEVAQKAKIKWSIEGDENSKYYHGKDYVKTINNQSNPGNIGHEIKRLHQKPDQRAFFKTIKLKVKRLQVQGPILLFLQSQFQRKNEKKSRVKSAISAMFYSRDKSCQS